MAENEFRVGALIENRYQVLSALVSGGMGTLYRVSDEAKDGEIVALKKLHLNVPQGRAVESVERFQREFQLLTRLRHPNLVSVYSYGVTAEGELYFTMEWVPGPNLETRVGQMSAADTIPVIVQICRALAYLHARDVIHGDLKPANVLLVEDQVKIVDFGVALETRSPEILARYYTPGYTAPEVKQQKPVDHRIDLYSLGALWYALLLGEPPMFMPGPQSERLIRLTLLEALEAQDQVPETISAVILRLLATSSQDRYASANGVIEAVNAVTGSTYALETRETASSYALRGRFVGRVAEMETLWNLWRQAQQGESRLVLVGGESGVGKTRLVEEFAVQAQLEGARVARGRCVERGGSAFHPWREVLRVLMRYVEQTGELDMSRVGAVLLTLLPELWQRDYMAGAVPLSSLDPQAAQQRLNDTITRVLRAAARQRPTVVVIEDIHWADEATQDLLEFLAKVPGEAGLLVCATYSDGEIDPAHPLIQLNGNRVKHISLSNLSPEMTTSLVRSMLGLTQLPTFLSERVQRTTGGNAFFVQELVRSLAEEGLVLQRTVGGWQIDRAALQAARLPESIRQVVEQRFEFLSVEARQILEWAAVVGPVFWDGAVAQVGRVSRRWVRSVLPEALEHELVFERDTLAFEGEREYIFAKPIVREVSYANIPGKARRDYHGRVAAWLLNRDPEQVEEHLGLVAEQLEGAGQDEQALVYLRRAGEQAAEQFANAEAIKYFSRALDLIPETDLAQRYDFLLAREKVYDLRGAREAQLWDLETLAELSKRMADRRRQSEVALCRANYAVMIGDYPAAIAAARSAVDLARVARDVDQEATGYMHWGRALWYQGNYEQARARLEQALTLAEALPQVQADSLRNLGNIADDLGDYAGAKAYLLHSLQICREIGDRRGESAALNNLGVASAEQGDYAEAMVHFEQTLRICQETGERHGEGVAFVNLGNLADELGDYATAKSHYEKALDIFDEIGDRQSAGYVLTCLGLLVHHLNDYEAGYNYCRQALAIQQKLGDAVIQSTALTFLGHTLLELDRLDKAASAYEQALTLRRELGQNNQAMEPLAGLAQVAWMQGDSALALARVKEILDHLEYETLDGTAEPFWIYLTCYRILRENQDPWAADFLNTARRLLHEQAAKISDERLRRSFLENVFVHREILEFAAGAGKRGADE